MHPVGRVGQPWRSLVLLPSLAPGSLAALSHGRRHRMTMVIKPNASSANNGSASSQSQLDRLRAFMQQSLGAQPQPEPAMQHAGQQQQAAQQSGQAAQSATASSSGGGGGGGGSGSMAKEGGWGASAWEEDWDPADNLGQEELNAIADEAEEGFRSRPSSGMLRDKWITPLLDFQSVAGAVDLDQERTEENLQGEALANQDESQRALRYAAQLVGIPLVTGFVLSRALADPVLSFTLQNNEDAFAMTDQQKIEGARAVHIEEARMRMDAAIGKAPPLTEEGLLEHLREYAVELEEEERQHNEQTVITIVSDSVSSVMLFGMLVQRTRGRTALFNTIARLFEGLSDIAKAVMIILIADTLLGYHSEEGWTGFIELVAGHYGVEAEEEGMVIFVGVVPVVIDVFFKYWIFVGLNKISPGAVVTIKQVDTH